MKLMNLLPNSQPRFLNNIGGTQSPVAAKADVLANLNDRRPKPIHQTGACSGVSGLCPVNEFTKPFRLDHAPCSFKTGNETQRGHNSQNNLGCAPRNWLAPTRSRF
jgi:hypothetical protein